LNYDADMLFGERALNFGEAKLKEIQPKKLISVSESAWHLAYLSTADQETWGSVSNGLLPMSGVFNGDRLYLYLDGSVSQDSQRK
jgi:hypothetical protein